MQAAVLRVVAKQQGADVRSVFVIRGDEGVTEAVPSCMAQRYEFLLPHEQGAR
jgi:hypothetical protein